MRILALDLATRTGSSVDTNDGIVTSWCDFSAGLKKPTHGQLFEACDNFVCNLLHDYSPDIVVVEDQVYRGKGSRLLGGFKAIVQLRCANTGLRFIDAINAAKSRLLALGNGGLSKEDAATFARIQFGLSTDLKEDEVDARILHEAARVWLAQEATQPKVKAKRKSKKKRPA